MPWPSPAAFREPDTSPSVVVPAAPGLPREAIALSISLLTLPLLGSLVASRWAMAGLIQLGTASEELFRGDRLPLLREPSEDEGL